MNIETELIVLFGCGDKKELEARIILALSVFNDVKAREKFPYLLMTGNNSEIAFIKDILKNNIYPDWALLGENNSNTTIDNVVNTFSIVYDLKNNIKYYDKDNCYEAYPFVRYHMVSSAYHIKRIKFILDTLEYLKNEQVSYHGSLVYKSIRLITEYNIETNIDSYKNTIIKYK